MRTTLGLLAIGGIASVAVADVDPFLGNDGAIYPNPTIVGRAESYGSVQGDFNEDGIEDYVLTGTDFSLPRLMLSLGNCDFSTTAVSYWGIGNGSIGDFNEDGHQDLVLAREWGAFEILLGKGDGTFQPEVEYDVPGSFSGLGWTTAVADFDEDGHEDVLYGWFYNLSPFAFFSGNGDGTFDTAVTFGSGQGAAFGVGDFNGDTHLDFVAGGSAGDMNIWLGTGTGAFTNGGSFFGGDDPWEYIVHDFDGDSALDVVAVTNSNDLSVFLGNGDGTFQPRVTYAMGSEGVSAVRGDFDSDGNQDLMVGSLDEPVLSFFTGNGDGTFDPAIEIPQVQPPGALMTSDVNGDGYLDVILPGFGAAFLIHRGLGDGTFDGPGPGYVASPGVPQGVQGVAFGELNGDGRQDAVFVAGFNQTRTATVRLADGTGAFNETASFTLPAFPTDVAIADPNNDSNGDVIVSTLSNTVVVYPGVGDGTFGSGLSTVQEAVGITTGAFDADSNEDLAAIRSSASGMIDIQLGNGNGKFTFGSSYAVGDDPVEIVSGDFNEDTIDDLAVFNEVSEDISVLIGVGDGTFLPEVRYPLVDSLLIPTLKVFDVNDDGHEDLAAAESNVFYGAGDGTFAPAVTFFGTAGGAFAFGDTNGDGRSDFVNPSSLTLLWLGMPDGGFASTFQRFANAYATTIDMIVEDTNGDSRSDLIFASSYGISVMLNVEQAPFNFGADKATMTWPSVTGALSYNIYRGLISSLVDGDSDGLPDSGYGDCQNALDPDVTDTHYIDATPPPPGDGYFYLIAVKDWAGERDLGRTSEGLARVPGTPCP